MKKLETRIVEYYGMGLEIPACMSYVATDEGGDIYAFENKPNIVDKVKIWFSAEGEHVKITDFANPNCDWAESLRYYPVQEVCAKARGEETATSAQPQSERARQFAEWFDDQFQEGNVPASDFSPEIPWSVLHYVQNNTGLSIEKIKREVIKHIDEYTVPQYGDAPNDNVEQWPRDYCMAMVRKYKEREHTSQRSEGFLDCWKMLHYCQLAHCKPKQEEQKTHDRLVKKLLFVFNAMNWFYTPDGIVHIIAVDRNHKEHTLRFDVRDWMESGYTQEQTFEALDERIEEFVDNAKTES